MTLSRTKSIENHDSTKNRTQEKDTNDDDDGTDNNTMQISSVVLDPDFRYSPAIGGGEN